MAKKCKVLKSALAAGCDLIESIAKHPDRQIEPQLGNWKNRTDDYAWYHFEGGTIQHCTPLGASWTPRLKSVLE